MLMIINCKQQKDALDEEIIWNYPTPLHNKMKAASRDVCKLLKNEYYCLQE